VSRTRFPPAPKELSAMNSPRIGQFGAAPATMAKMEQIMREKLKAIFLPMISALIPQKSAPMSIPEYAAMVMPLG